MSGYNFHGVEADGDGLNSGTDVDYSVEFTTPKATHEDFVELHAKITSVVESSKGAYTIKWLDDKHDTFVVKEGDKEVFTASQTSANFNTPINNDILKAYLAVMHNKQLDVVINSCPDLDTAKKLVLVAEDKNINVQVKVTQQAKEQLIKSLGKSPNNYDLAWIESHLKVYTPEPKDVSEKKQSPSH